MQVHQLGGLGFDGNVFLVLAGRSILIDAGTGMYSGDILKAARKLLQARKLDRLVLTHRHFDHTGGAYSLSSELAVDVYISEADLKPVAEGDSLSTGAWMFGSKARKVDCSVLRLNLPVDLGDVKLNVIQTPGHSIGSICLWEPRSRSLFSGDTVFSGGGVGRWDLDTGDLGQLRASVRKLAGMDVENLYPGHGESIEGDAAASIKWSLEGIG